MGRPILPPAGNFKTLRRAAVMVATALDEGRSYSLERQHAYLVLGLAVLEAAAKDATHDLAWFGPLLGTSDPDAPPKAHLAPAEHHALAAYHREEASLVNARKSLGPNASTPGQDGSTPCASSPRAMARQEVTKALKEKEKGAGKGGGK